MATRRWERAHPPPPPPAPVAAKAPSPAPSPAHGPAPSPRSDRDAAVKAALDRLYGFTRKMTLAGVEAITVQGKAGGAAHPGYAASLHFQGGHGPLVMHVAASDVVGGQEPGGGPLSSPAPYMSADKNASGQPAFRIGSEAPESPHERIALPSGRA
jgi:hypothetical protein